MQLNPEKFAPMRSRTKDLSYYFISHDSTTVGDQMRGIEDGRGPEVFGSLDWVSEIQNEISTTGTYKKPRYVTKQGVKIMDQDGKLDLLKKMEEVEKKREESEKKRERSEEKSRAELMALKAAVESRFPAVKKRVDALEVCGELKQEIRSAVLMQKPQDLDSACSLAFLQDEILEGSKSVSHKKSDKPILVKNSLKSLSPQSHSNSVVKGNASPPSEDRRGSDNTRARDDRLAALRSYRRSKVLCFTCGERWSKEHKCANSVQLHICHARKFPPLLALKIG
uniref:OSJNBa0059H15.6 protein n=1 Tax=Oryza sativa subsp. japonica TaxID=39947 RepID=Q7XXI3_ORYSJ|nr:OSJNBa0059H15.6 [Oryza sativa Japonica Group]